MPKPRSADSSPVNVAATVRVDAYAVISRAVEEGIGYGIGRLWKYHDSDTMTEAYMREHEDAIYHAVTGALCEILRFGDE